ncbi:MAG: RnfABCDGE type electron transport complex subunit D [Oscillospiraceae bacterium]|nr:RnfABCDGE type electron transport complex subunit D [Oscillospiraceae bacterium]
MKDKLIVSSSPHLRAGRTTTGIMLDVIIALMPALVASIIYFGYRAAILIAVCVATCVVAEFVSRKIMKRENTLFDLSAVVTGILLAFNLPAGLNPIIAAIGSVVAIIVVKQMFGGLGQNFVNPALTARIVLLVSFPTPMTTWASPFYYWGGTDAMTTATVLGGGEVSLLDMFLGNQGGSLGETCALALIIGGIYLVIRKVISPLIPLCYMGTVALFTLIYSACTGGNIGVDILTQLLSGGLMLGAIFMATDYATTPINWRGKIVFAIGCGILTMVIRLFGSLPEGVSFAIILMNILTPLIEKATSPRPFGKERKAS